MFGMGVRSSRSDRLILQYLTRSGRHYSEEMAFILEKRQYLFQKRHIAPFVAADRRDDQVTSDDLWVSQWVDDWLNAGVRRGR
jgi:hypothetical protein